MIAPELYQHYLDKGIAKIPAAGIVGVLAYESKLNPSAENNTGSDRGGVINPAGAYGLAQWNGDRQKALSDYAAAKTLDVHDIYTQADFVLTESANSYPKVWEAIQKGDNQTLEDFVSVFVRQYENPKNPQPEIDGAIVTAKLLLANSIVPAPVKQPETPAPSGLVDRELLAIQSILNILSLLPTGARTRVIQYVQTRNNSNG